ncbi:helix-turn-helix transcriptional regulator [Billgrantia kenyensis]|uniref:Transcriptional regulator n=1 Tax=Billgrantia kenyensis TaxID=321266 RepID=A0A7W0AEV9_9GAMM|nr:metalloregulator ArsR/SmtB family transcription factor [Halomonas kenyensis]MBA2780563.1 transcriptional regulator [Halomonas kenyensis]MCG6663256.1 transcriptional regulator [Halomonas kenyensis]
MSSNQDGKAPGAPSDTAERLLWLLKTRGPHSAAELGERLGTSGENARQQLTKLSRQGLVDQRKLPGGVGRPVVEWRLSATGHARFPDRHAELTTRLIASVRDTLGDEAMERLVEARQSETLAQYREALADAASVEERVERLTEIRSHEGYMAEWQRDEDGSLLLIENHCPICQAASTCPDFCRSELEVFRAVLGESVSVERTDHVLAGARRCVYRIQEI